MTKEIRSNACRSEEPFRIIKPGPGPNKNLAGVSGPQSCCQPSGDAADGGGPVKLVMPPAAHWIKGPLETVSGQVAQVATALVFKDIAGAWKARWGINRMNFRVAPGLYAVGNPDGDSVVFVTANYKMSFDRLRKELTTLKAWILVLDTKGINVWCAAGKGTFGTAELVRQIAATGLSRIVNHRTLVLPQLGAPGVSAHEVQKLSGFKVVYGPVRARDIKAFLDAGMKTDRQMRTVTFGFLDRLVLTPVELANILKPAVVAAVMLFIAHFTGLLTLSPANLLLIAGAVLVGAVAAPALLPWIPGHAFSFKGWITGLIWTAAILYWSGPFFEPGRIPNTLALLLILPAISAFLTLNFTGASTYTSLSGVKREMRFAMPAIIGSASTGVLIWLVGLFI